MQAQLDDIRREISGTTTCGLIEATTHGTQNTAKKLTSTSTYVRKAIVRTADSGNSASITIGPTSTPNFAVLPAGGAEYVIEAPLGKRFDISTWYSTSAAATQAFKVLYFA